MIKPGIFSDTIMASSPEATAERTLMAGVEAVQLRLNWPGLDLLHSAADRRCVRRAYNAAGIEIAALAVYTNLLHVDPEQRATNRAYFEQVISIASELGTRKVVTRAGTYNPTDQWADHPDNHTPAAWEELLAVTAAMAQVCEREGVQLVYEPYVHSVVASAHEAQRLLHDMRSHAPGFVFAPARLLTAKTVANNLAITQEALQLLQGHIALAYADDVRYNKQGEPVWFPLGWGELDAEAVVCGLQERGYAGALIVDHVSSVQVPEALALCRRYLPCPEPVEV